MEVLRRLVLCIMWLIVEKQRTESCRHAELGGRGRTSTNGTDNTIKMESEV